MTLQEQLLAGKAGLQLIAAKQTLYKLTGSAGY